MKFLISILFMFGTKMVLSQDIFNFKKDMVWVESAKLYVCKYEVTNVEYRAFTSDLFRDSLSYSKGQIYSSFYPDTTLWVSEFRFGMGDGMNKYYYWHEAYNGYPVSGVSYKGAVKYCEWLTKKYGGGKYRFRLPSKKEFLMYSKVGNSKLAGGIDAPIDNYGKYLFNCKPDKIYLNEFLSRVFYNPSDDTFLRCVDDTSTRDKDESWPWGIKGYEYSVENSYDGYLYISNWKDKIIKHKISDSITFYDMEAKTYAKERLVLRLDSNYCDDGYMYTSPTRGYKNFSNGIDELVDSTGNIKQPVDKIIFKPNKSSYPPDKNGLFDLNGNVSELVSDYGFIMGGNWNCDINDCYYSIERKTEDIHQVLIGFRIVAEEL